MDAGSTAFVAADMQAAGGKLPGAIAGRRPRRRVAHADRQPGSWSRRGGHSGSPLRAPASGPHRQPELPATLQTPVVEGPRGSTLLMPSIGGDAA
jgi:hypothetical protein